MDSSREVGVLVDHLGAWSAGSGPLYRRLADSLHGLVTQGTVLVGERLPSERALASALRISRTTVVSAYDALRTEGVLESRQGSGTRVSASVGPVRGDGWVPGSLANPMYQNLLRETPRVISTACMRTPALGVVEEAVREVVDQDLPALLADESDHPRGLPVLRQAIADH